MPERGSPLWWVERLEKKHDERRMSLDLLDRYYEGDHPLPIAPARLRQKFLHLLAASRANWTGLVVDAVADRLHIDGFRFDLEAEQADDDAWAIWQENELDAESELVHNEALVAGETYVSVWVHPDDDSRVLIAPEHPAQISIAQSRTNRRNLDAALKIWLDEWTGKRFSTLYLRDGIYKFEAPETGGQWTERDVTLANPLGVVPIVAFRNRPRMRPRQQVHLFSLGVVPHQLGRSEISDVLDIQDRINTTLFGRLVAAEFTAFRQRYVTGMEIETDEEDNAKPPPFEAAVDRLWQAEDEGTKFGEFSATDLGPYIKSVESDVNAMAAITRTPPQYLLGAMVNISGDALKAAESGLAAKAASRTRHYGEAWERVMRLAFKVLEDPRGDVTNSEVIWRDVETRTEGERVDALVKMKDLGVPTRALWQRWGASQTEIERWEKDQVAEALAAQAVDLSTLQP